jgi:hypothetical protein
LKRGFPTFSGQGPVSSIKNYTRKDIQSTMYWCLRQSELLKAVRF